MRISPIATLVAASLAAPAIAQEYPTKSITVTLVRKLGLAGSQ